MSKDKLKSEILEKTAEYYRLAFGEKTFEPGITKIPYAGRVFDEDELLNLIESSLEFWLTEGRFSKKFEKEFTQFLGVKHCSLVNSGSSANLLAFMTLTSDELGERKIQKGDEVITVAATFPTTITPIIQYGAVPVFLDITLESLNIDVTQLNQALTPKTKAVMLAHTLGNPFDLNSIKKFCDKHHLWLIEDNCDALGSTYDGKLTGTFGDIATSSFYPPHHITMGEGGAVYTNDDLLNKIIKSLRDWGRDCWCPPGKDNTCGKRFSHNQGSLPFGYDHKYIYTHFGYNLKVTDMQAAIGCAQLKKLPAFVQRRRDNYEILSKLLKTFEEYFLFSQPTPKSNPSWFGFLMTVREEAKFSRNELIAYLEKRKIQTRMLFAGNIIRHPCFDELRKSGKGYRVIGDLNCSDHIMNNSLWIGVYPGMSRKMIEYIVKTIKTFILEK